MRRTQETGLALLRRFRPLPCDSTKYFHSAQASTGRIFHPVTRGDGSCKLDPARTERDITARVGGNLSNVGWERITREQMTTAFRLHTTALDLEQRTHYVTVHNDRARALVLGNHDARGVEASAQRSVSARQN